MLAVRTLRAALVCLLVFFIALCIRWSFPRDNKLMDLGSFLASGRAAAEGLNPYEVYELTTHFESGDVQGYAINRNPPVSLLLFQLLGRFEPFATFRAWYFFSLAVYTVAVVLLCRDFPPQATPLRVVWTFGLAGVWSTVNLGQIYMPLVLLSTVGYLSLRKKRFVLSGILIGCLVAIKPNFLVWPALMGLAGYWTPASVAIITGGLLSLTPVSIYGLRVYPEWIGTFASHPWVAFPTNASLFGLMARLGVPWLGVALSAILLVTLAMWTWRLRPSLLALCDLALLGSLLASPEAWTGYTLFLLPVFFRRRWTPLVGAAAVLLLVPETIILTWSKLSEWHFAAFAYLDNGALLLLLAALLSETRRDAVGDLKIDGGWHRSRCADDIHLVHSGQS